jgi:hypothetical protein
MEESRNAYRILICYDALFIIDHLEDRTIDVRILLN